MNNEVFCIFGNIEIGVRKDYRGFLEGVSLGTIRWRGVGILVLGLVLGNGFF